jgi:isoleucyl-tRNA synthetase
VLAEIEKARAAGRIKAPREARAYLRINGNELEAFYRNREKQLPAILGVSQADLSQEASVNGIDIDIQKSEGGKCPRCWIYKTDIGADKAWPEVCGRCAGALEEQPKTMTEA